MTHTNTQPEALALADDLDSTSPQCETWQVSAELRRLHARVQELEAERDEADRRAGRAERHMAGMNDDVRRFEAARRRMKAQWGVHDNVSFDVAWQQALDAKASQAQRVPLSEVMNLVIEWGMASHANGEAALDAHNPDATPDEIAYADECVQSECAAWKAIEDKLRAHGITQEKQG